MILSDQSQFRGLSSRNVACGGERSERGNMPDEDEAGYARVVWGVITHTICTV